MLVNQLNLIPSTNTNFIKKYSTYPHIYKTLFPHKLQLEKIQYQVCTFQITLV